jgi:hypothetical protein
VNSRIKSQEPGFASELKLLRAEIDANTGSEDLHHIKKIALWGRLCSIAGYATAWIIPNPVSALLITRVIWSMDDAHASRGT